MPSSMDAPSVSAVQAAAQWHGLDRTRAGCRVAGGTRSERQPNLTSASGRTIMRPHSAFSIMSLLLLAMLLGLGPVIAGRAQDATPEATPMALAWSACAIAGGWECATLPVPLDYANPTGPTIDIALTRLPAADPARRIGALVFNCGGPGCPTVTFMQQLGLVLFPDETRARFDFLGLSYGVSIGARYADRYPDRVRAFALDSALPAVADTATFVPEWVDAIERAFDAYLADCASALTCPFHSGGDPAAAFDALMAKLDAAPLEVSTESGTRLVGQRAVLDAVNARLSGPSGWPDLAAALAAAAGG